MDESTIEKAREFAYPEKSAVDVVTREVDLPANDKKVLEFIDYLGVNQDQLESLTIQIDSQKRITVIEFHRKKK